MVQELRILLVEDLASDAELMAFELRQANLSFTLRRVENEAEFVRELEEFHPDLILSDFHLPAFNGLEVLAMAQERCPDLPFIFVSGAIGEEVAIDTLKRGATDYVLKERLSRLPPAVERAMREAAERRQAEVALRESEQRYRLLVQNIPAVVYQGYTDWSVDFIDDKIEGLTGYKKEEFDSRRLKWCDLIVPEDLEEVKNSFRRGQEFGSAYLREYRIKTKDSKVLWLQDRGQIICNLDGRVEYVSGVFFDITESQRAKMALQESEQRLRFLTSQLLTAQEQERKRISMELHDELGQSLAVLKLQIRAIQRNLRDDQLALRQECGELLDYLDGVIDNTRRLSRDLSPSILEDLGLQSALKYLLEGVGKHFTVEHSFEINELDSLFPPEAQITIYRIFQECLNNISKHAGACKIAVAVRPEDGAVSFTLEDDGTGFDVAEVLQQDASARGLGLAALDERARMLGGHLEIHSREGVGTRIVCTIPVKQEKNQLSLESG